MPDAAPASHAGYSCTDKITHPFYRLNLLPIPPYHSPRKGARPLCYFLGEKVTQKHFHTAAPLGRQYESAFARSRGGSLELPAATFSRYSQQACSHTQLQEILFLYVIRQSWIEIFFCIIYSIITP